MFLMRMTTQIAELSFGSKERLKALGSFDAMKDSVKLGKINHMKGLIL